MDLLRPRAIPALIAALACASAAADCASLQGTYRYKSAGPGEPVTLSVLTLSKERSKLFRAEDKPAAPGSLGSDTQRARPPKMTPLADTATLTHTAKDTRLRFKDATGAVLAEMSINDMGPWSCKENHLERGRTRTAGLGDAVHTEKVIDTLERNEAGDLVLRTTIKRFTLPGTGEKPVEARFPAVR